MFQGREGGDNKEGAPDVFEGVEVVEEGHTLDGFAEPHFVCKNHVSIFVPRTDQPIETLELVISEQTPVFINGLILCVVLEMLFLCVVVVQFLLNFHYFFLVLITLILPWILFVF